MKPAKLHSRAAVSCLALATALVFGGLAAPAHAQEDDAAAEDEQRGNTIVVTGLRRDSELQDTPAAVTAFGAQAIEDARIVRPADFVNLTPNVNLVETQNAGNAFVIIRGITQARNSEPSVAVVVDGVLQVNPAQFNQQLFDIEQIEVMKGPQGALYGRNAIGGAIIVTTRDPSDTLEGSFTAGVDNGFGYSLRGGISGPLSDSASFRLSASWQDTDGYIPNEFLGEEADPVENLSIRGRLNFELSDTVELDLRASMDQLRTQALYFNIVQDVNDTSLPVRVNNAGQNDRDIYNVSAKITMENDSFTVTSVTSYDWLEEILTGDAFDFLPIEESYFFTAPPEFGGLGFDLNQSQYLDVEAFSQELRFESPSNQDLFWMFGGYLIATERYISTGNMVDTGNGVFPVFREPSMNPLNPQATFLADSQDNFAWALFGNVGYQFSDAFRVDASLRYDHDKRKQVTLTPTGFLPNVPGFPQGASGDIREISFDDLQPKLTLTYTPSTDVTLYGGYSRGFRSGGFNQTGVGAVAFSNGIVGVEDIYEAETADSFELGTKLQLFDRMLSLNAAGYYTTSKNSYFFVFLAANSTQNLGNVGEVEIYGVEMEAELRPTSDLSFNAAWGLTYSSIKEFPDPSVIGNEAPLISRSTLNLGAQYNPELTADLDLLLRADYRRTGRTWWDVPNSTVRDPIHLVNARVGVEGGNWGLYGFATNLFNEEYNAEFSPGGFVFKARPRVYGVEATYRY